MVFTLYALLEAALLCINAIAVLNEQRFLAKVGWSSSQPQGYGEETGVKSKLMNVITSVQTLLRVPLIGLNMIAILLLILFG